MPYSASVVEGKDANSQNQNFLVAGDGSASNPFMPLHGDLGVGSVDDLPATSTLAGWSLISLTKSVINRLMSLVDGVGDPGDVGTATVNGNFSLISVNKGILARLIILLGTPGDSIAVGNPGLIGGWSIVSILKAVHLAIVGDTTTPYASINDATAAVIKVGAGYLHSLSCMNPAAGTRYLLIFDRITTPTTGNAPFRTYPVYGNSGMTQIDELQWGKLGLTFQTGITWAISTTPYTYTPTTDNNLSIEARYR
jgi:hypothetical protein